MAWEAHQPFCTLAPVPEELERLAGSKALLRHARRAKEKRRAAEDAREAAWIARQSSACIKRHDARAASGPRVRGTTVAVSPPPPLSHLS